MNRKSRIEKLRNFGIIAHIDAGKTTTSERILFLSGAAHKLGEVDEGTTVMDWMDQERERGITITSAVTTTTWREHILNLIDTPGHVDFTAEVQRSLRVLDGAVLVVCGVAGVEPQSEQVWRQATAFRVPRVVFINKLDRLGADFPRVLADLRRKLGGTFVPLLVPTRIDAQIIVAIDVIAGTLVSWEGNDPQDQAQSLPLPPESEPSLLAAREALVEATAEFDETLLDDFLRSGTLDPGKALRALRRATLTGSIHPVLCGSSLKNRGVRRLLDAIVDFLPSPLDVPAVVGTKPDDDEPVARNPHPELPLTALIYKVMNDESQNRLYYTRIYSGILHQGDTLWNPRRESVERVGRMVRMSANRKEALEEAGPGDIVALVGLKRSSTGDTLCPRDNPIVLEPISFPNPVISMAIEPKNQAELEQLQRALGELAAEDPTFLVRDDVETGQKIISGMGELHLEVLVDRLRREFHLDARVGKPQVAYRETISKPASGTGRFHREIAEKLHHAEVRLLLTPRERNSGFSFAANVSNAPGPVVRWVEDAARLGMGSGPFAGYPLVDVAATLTGLEFVAEAPSEIAIKGATAEAFRDALAGGDVILLEPVVRLEVLVPREFSGEVLRDLNARRAHMEIVESRDLGESARCIVPLSKMFGYATDLRSLTRGRGTFSMVLAHFEPALEAMAQFRGTS